MKLLKNFLLVFFILISRFSFGILYAQDDSLHLNDMDYLELPGLNVMLGNDYYPEGHQGGISIIQNGERVATNGDIRLEPTPGQWQPIPKVVQKSIDKQYQEISLKMEYPNPDRNNKGFNPIDYPDLNFSYTVRIRPEGKSFRIMVDLDHPLPKEWIGRVGFNLELFPGILFGKSWYLDDRSGIFPRQLNGPLTKDPQGDFQIVPMASGRKLSIAPESEKQRMIIQSVHGGDLQLLDGRAQHNNGWFVVRSLIPAGAATGAIEWLVSPHAIPGWRYRPVVEVSQVGYHPGESKIAIIELDTRDKERLTAELLRISENGGYEKIKEDVPGDWGNFLRYHYLRFDFSDVKKAGMYEVKYGDYETEPFMIGDSVYHRNVWQPTLEYFLPVQMCHMRINDRYKVWHGACHMDDARMAPLNYNHIDGYFQGSSTLCKYNPGDPIPGLNQGGWHDAGDYDLRVESQAETIYGLAQAWEAFHIAYDNTTIDQIHHIVEIQKPDGKPDILQQIEHGALSIVGAYLSMGRLYRGIICPTLRQYTLLGDPVNMTDNIIYNPASVKDSIPVGLPGSPDDRWVFTENNPRRELEVAADLAGASRALKGFNDTLSEHCLQIAEDLWNKTIEKDPLQRVKLAVELLVTTRDKKYADFLLGMKEKICEDISHQGWVIGPSLSLVPDQDYTTSIREAVKTLSVKINEQEMKNPYGVPYEPDIWGAGWGIQAFGLHQYFLHQYFPDIFPDTYMLNALHFILGCHPGSNTSSFVSGVGARSLTVAYGFNRDDWYYIPGGSASGTALIRPDFPELLTWPYLWQQTEYVLGGGTTDYLFLVLAAAHLLNEK